MDEHLYEKLSDLKDKESTTSQVSPFIIFSTSLKIGFDSTFSFMGLVIEN